MEKYLVNDALQWGSDPEIFIVDGKGDILPSWKFLPVKERAEYTDRVCQDYHVKAFTDGFQAECTTYAARCIQLQVLSIKYGLRVMLHEARKVDPKAKFSIENTPVIRQDYLDNEPMDNVMLGCSPSKNAYGLLGAFPGNPRKLNVRFAGGHIHVSNFAHPDWVKRYVKAFDKILGIYHVATADGIDMPLRRVYYGQPGEHRRPAWGLEYRTLSNAWVLHPAMANLTFNVARGVIDLVDAEMDNQIPYGDELTVDVINNCDVKMARNIITANADLFAAILLHGFRYAEYEYWPSMLKGFFVTAEKGMLNTMPDIKDVEKNWCLSSENWPGGSPPFAHEWRGLCPKLFPVKSPVSVIAQQ